MKAKYILLVLPITFLLIFLSCNKTNPPETGAVKATLYDYTGLDGCGWVIKLESDEVLEPINLSDFDVELKEGKSIWVRYHLRNDLGSYCMVGQIAEIEGIWDR